MGRQRASVWRAYKYIDAAVYVWRMIHRRATAAGIEIDVCCRTFRATGTMTFLTLSGKLEVAQQMAAHESIRTTTLYDLRASEVSLEDVMGVGI